MTSTYELSEFLPQFLVDTSNLLKEVQVVDVASSQEEQLDDVDEVEEQ